MKATSGPWKLHPDYLTIVLGADKQPVADCSGVAEQFFHVKRTQQKRHVNALLIAAAPDLLEAAYMLRELILNNSENFKIQTKDIAVDLMASERIDKFHRAINKAEGKESA
jgi:hypothetical protein